MKAFIDIFPASIVVVPPGVVEDFTSLAVTTSPPKGGKYLERVRLVVMKDDESYILTVAGDHHSGPRVIFNERLEDLKWSGNKSDDSQAKTRSGKIISFKYVQGCNCGSRLRSWSPYRMMDSAKDPTE